jgi:hypothetical protein
MPAILGILPTGEPTMQRIKLQCLNNGKLVSGDVLNISAYHMRVVPEQTTVAINLHRDRLDRNYVGRAAGMEIMAAKSVYREH